MARRTDSEWAPAGATGSQGPKGSGQWKPGEKGPEKVAMATGPQGSKGAGSWKPGKAAWEKEASPTSSQGSKGPGSAAAPASARPELASDEDEAVHGVTLAQHAAISAEMAEGDRPAGDILYRHGLTEAAWTAATLEWMTRLAADVRVHGEKATRPLLYSGAFARAQDALKPLPAMDARAYAALLVAVEVAGGPAPALRARGLSLPDFLRLSRHFARVLASDPEETRAFFTTYLALLPSEAQDTGGEPA